VPIAPDAAWVEQLRATIPEQPSIRRARLAQDWGIGAFEMESLVNAGVLQLVETSVEEGVEPDAARKWWAGELLRVANERGLEPQDLPVAPGDIKRVEELIAAGTINDKLARSVFDGIISGEGDADAVVAARGLTVVSDESALLAAIEQALADQPDVAEKIRGGKVAAAGAIVGAVMKATRGQADAGKVRTLLLDHLGVAEG
jgi:Asp-tRNAAsn/Glu-tRNAGln amidotransferase B subunit (PET112 homolog)